MGGAERSCTGKYISYGASSEGGMIGRQRGLHVCVCVCVCVCLCGYVCVYVHSCLVAM